VIIGKEMSYHAATIQLSKEKLIRYIITCDHFAKATHMSLKGAETIRGFVKRLQDEVKRLHHERTT